MRLRVAATGSAANAYVLEAEQASLILDAGVPARRLFPYVGDIRKVAGCLLTHEHGDHARAWREYARLGVKVFTSPGTVQALAGQDALSATGLRALSPLAAVAIGSFRVLPFGTQHDAAEPFGFLIRYLPTGETALYVTDTYYLRYTFPGVHYWIVECNYIDDLVYSETDPALRRRLKESHLSLRRLLEALRANDLRSASKIVLVHLSDERSDEARMVEAIHEATGVETVAASSGADIALNPTPF